MIYLLLFHVYVFAYMCVYVSFVPGVKGGQKRVLYSLECNNRQVQLPCWLWGPKLGPLEEQQVL